MDATYLGALADAIADRSSEFSYTETDEDSEGNARDYGHFDETEFRRVFWECVNDVEQKAMSAQSPLR